MRHTIAIKRFPEDPLTLTFSSTDDFEGTVAESTEKAVRDLAFVLHDWHTQTYECPEGSYLNDVFQMCVEFSDVWLTLFLLKGWDPCPTMHNKDSLTVIITNGLKDFEPLIKELDSPVITYDI